MLSSLKEKLNSIRSNDGLLRYMFNTMWMLSDQVLRLIAGVVVGIWVARYLGPSDYGVFNYVIAFVAIFAVLAKLGLDNLVVKGLVDDPHKRDLFLGTGFWLKLFGSLLTFAIISGYLLLAQERADTSKYMLILASGLLFQSFEVIEFYFQAKVLSKFATICKTVQLVISSCVKLYLVYIKADLVWFIGVQCLDQVSLGLTQFIVYRIQAKNASFLGHFSWPIANTLLSRAWPLIFGNIAIMIYMRIDQIMIMNMIGEEKMGLFSAAVRLSEAWYFVPMVITNSLFPAILNAKKTDEKLYLSRLQHLFVFMVAISLAVAIPITILAPWLVTTLFGEPFRGGAPVLSLHVWTGLFTALGVASSGWFISENLLKFSLIKTLIGVVLNIALNFILIPKFGIIGAAISTIVSQASVSVFLNAFYRKSFLIFKMQMKAFTFMRN